VLADRILAGEQLPCRPRANQRDGRPACVVGSGEAPPSPIDMTSR
jgi:hypothetical protein